MTTGLRIRGRYPNIMIVGKMQAGKTTAASYLVEEYKYTKASLADPIKDIVNSLDSLKNEKIINTFIKPYYKLTYEKKLLFRRILDATRAIPNEFPKPRKRLQFLGTDGVRNNIDNKFWLKILSRRMEGIKRVVIDDCRFLNEYNYFKNLNYVDLKIRITQETQMDRLYTLHGGAFDLKILKHPSEVEQEKIFEKYPEHILDNDGSLEEFYRNIDEWIKKVR